MICKKCNSEFRSRQFIDGKERHLVHRKYCLVCSPFNKHNTRKLEVPPAQKFYDKPATAFMCSRCNKPKLQKILGTVCGGCRSTLKREKNRKAAIEFLGGRCKRCKYSKCSDALDFHHKDPSLKSFSLSTSWHRCWSLLLPEIEKCELLCANCHREIHSKP